MNVLVDDYGLIPDYCLIRCEPIYGHKVVGVPKGKISQDQQVGC